MMNTSNRNIEAECRDILNRFFDSNRDEKMRRRALKVLRFLAACEEPLLGKPCGWAGGAFMRWPTANESPAACQVY